MLEEKNILAARRPRRKKKDYFDQEIGSAKQKEISDKIAKIYEDDRGKIPNMKEIKYRRKNPLLRFAAFLIFISGVMAISAWAGFFYFPQGAKFSEEKISLSIEGPFETELGSTSTFKILIRNELDTPLKNISLNINYPEGFVFGSSDIPAQNVGKTEWILSDIPSYSVSELKISGQNFGSLNQQGSLRVFLNYQPGSLNSKMQKIATFSTRIASSPFVLTAKTQDRAAFGSNFEINYTLENKGSFIPEKMFLSFKIPENFSITSSTPALDKDNKWLVSATSSASYPQNFKIIGRFNGEIDATTSLKAVLELPLLFLRQTYQVGQIENQISLTRTSYLINLAINGAMNDFNSKPGESLNITVNFKNAGKTSVKNALIVLKLDAPSIKKISILDWPEITDPLDGNIIGKQINDTLRNGTITWNKTNLKDLAEIKAGQEINIDLKLPIKNDEKIELDDLKEFKIATIAEISFTDETKIVKTVASNPIKITLNSDFSFEKRVLVAQNGSGKDQRDITWVLSNTFHPLKNIELTAEVYGDVTFVSSTLPAGKLTYDPKEKIITWKIDEMPESVDVLAFPFTIIINKKNPSQQVLVSKIKIQAEDATTAQLITFMGTETLLFEESADAGETVNQFFEDLQE